MYRRYIPLVAFSLVEENTHWDKRILFSSLLLPHFNCSGSHALSMASFLSTKMRVL